MELQEYIEKNSKKKVSADIAGKWQARFVDTGYADQGEAGALFYLSAWGKNIGFPKLILLAVQAQNHEKPNLAMAFWKCAYKMEFGTDPGEAVAIAPSQAYVTEVSAVPHCDLFPEHLQPGKIVTMQPDDTELLRETLIANPQMWCQPKRDGNKVVAIVSPRECWFQSRERLRTVDVPGMSETLIELAAEIGAFIVEGELCYVDAANKEHRTGSQCITANRNLGKSAERPMPMYSIFHALFYGSVDLTSGTQARRTMIGLQIAEMLNQKNPLFEILETAITEETKRALCQRQLDQGREGEVWMNTQMPYKGGKIGDKYCRTKYVIEFEARVTELTKSTNPDYLFGAIRIVDVDGKSLGTVGMGCTRAEQRELVDALSLHPDDTWINVRAQNMTESGVAFHARYLGLLPREEPVAV